ncbi:hypothetical protein NLG97_g9358 [Lecanicillium saksenae]|uniref:Uncharacterized protein n=1 Tax=Lecanicillium saksenae TaxID=468837 RepID=A0ACC1QG94_9HYPO|nr:hypothetical protein NLG97_g9358 [Lecanicillium saksenae]
MADKAKERIDALGKQLGLPEIKRKAGPSNALRLEGKVAIITGANSPMGIGRATAHQYAESGARAIYICDFDATHLENHKKQINAAYPNVDVHVRQFDAGDEAKVKAVVDDAMEKYKRLDIFFANAGIIGKYGAFSDYNEQEFMEVMRTNSWR